MYAYWHSPSTKKTMGLLFRKNLEKSYRAFSEPISGEHLHSSQALQSIIDTCWSKEFRQEDIPEKEGKKLRAFYKQFAQDAAHYKEFMGYVIEHKNAKELFESKYKRDLCKFPLAYSLYLFCKNCLSNSPDTL
jgi:hypothetical protein